jgi:hypothetical protein
MPQPMVSSKHNTITKGVGLGLERQTTTRLVLPRLLREENQLSTRSQMLSHQLRPHDAITKDVRLALHG